ncbi:hypothetical protein IMCC3317_28710 [Kordia antarctica]|uniref:DUF4837 domain-containing protein n=1 Tax=Kordia antarctica TaxID=1218801 RepID=A0A7L4ZLH5_9FLAO|nr:DUF4837 family protein [Kordia antarctica]QHI37492.1 hypothetical protein IMCC3317_28710 [Kordia antarctica]
MKKLYILLLALVVLSSCENGENADQYLPESFGKVNLLTVVIDLEQWKGKVGDSIRSIYGAPTDGLPMEEPLFSLKQINPDVFDGLLLKCRSILIVKSSDKKQFKIRENLYAKPQKIVFIGGNEDEIISQLTENARESILTLKLNELRTKQNFISESLNNDKELEETLGITLNIPSIYKTVKVEDNFVWYEREVSNGTMNIIAYTLPFGSIPKNDSTIDAIIKMRDSIGKLYVPGRDPRTMHMITEKAYAPYLYDAIIDNKPALETKGMWEMKGFHMAGPFINYIVEDKQHNRLVVIEGFTFAPSEDKRDFMFEIEAILKTLDIKE